MLWWWDTKREGKKLTIIPPTASRLQPRTAAAYWCERASSPKNDAYDNEAGIKIKRNDILEGKKRGTGQFKKGKKTQTHSPFYV